MSWKWGPEIHLYWRYLPTHKDFIVSIGMEWYANIKHSLCCLSYGQLVLYTTAH